ncbi:MAG: class I SAM-dependent RNA methyltransferase [Puniceicoccales bacterium]|nr:class I SAM-dependent RNA methyltransferase [Puniceicoccales bacterium]
MENFTNVPFKYHEEVQLEISDMANGGFGVGRVNNWVVMVPYVCVGEVVAVKIYKNLKNYSLGDLVSIVRPADARVKPKCPLFGTCGGCQYQHMAYGAQLSAKRNQIVEIMKRIGGVEFPVNECIGSDRHYNYRSKITPHFQKSVPPIGFLENGRRRIVDVEECPIATENINRALPTAREKIFAEKGSLRKGGTLLLRDLGTNVVTDPKASVSQSVGIREFSFRAGEFFQNNAYMLPELANFASEVAAGPKYLIDAFCGVGVFGVVAAEKFERVAGIEVSEVAVNFARLNAAKNGAANVEFTVGTAEQIFAAVEFPGCETSVIIDPPRTGCDANFLRQLMEFAPEKIVYVSCSPDTQARDLKIISQAYAVGAIQPFDMFPQTRHIENVVVLSRVH